MSEERQARQPTPITIGNYDGKAPPYSGINARSFYLPMRDGVKLAVDLLLPQDLEPETRIPALLVQSRYWRSMVLRAPFKWFLTPEKLDPYFGDMNQFFTDRGYAVLLVDVRGTGASFGTWDYPWQEEAFEDGREIVDWIIAQPWSSGKVGAHGISYLGTTAEMLVGLNHPAVKAVIPMFNHPDAYRDIAFPGGIFNDRFIRSWGHFDKVLDRNKIPIEFGRIGQVMFQGVKPVDGDRGRKQLAGAVTDHAGNTDSYQLASILTYRNEPHPEKPFTIDHMTVHHRGEQFMTSKTATCGWGSWMDAGTADAVIRRFITYPGAVRGVIGAWEHGGRFNASPFRPKDAPAAPPLPEQWREMLRFFDAHLKAESNDEQSERVLDYYLMGAEEWRRTPIWPPEGSHPERWYLSEGGILSQEMSQAETGADTYQVDFETTTGVYNRWWEMGVLDEETVYYPDRAEEDRRLLTYTSPPLAEDLEITGWPVINLVVSSTETDGAFYVYLEDISPDGCVTYITEGQLRALHRNVSTEPAPYYLSTPYHTYRMADAAQLVPGCIATLTFGLLPTAVRIQQGHCLRVAIAGHDSGTFARIPATGDPVITIQRNRRFTSWIDLPVLTNATGFE